MTEHHAVPVKRTMNGKGTCKVCGQATYSDRGIYRHVENAVQAVDTSPSGYDRSSSTAFKIEV